MGQGMSEQPLRLRWLVLLGGVWAGGVCGCATREGAVDVDERGEGVSSAAEAGHDSTRGEPQQIVQRIAPAPEHSNGASKPSASNGKPSSPDTVPVSQKSWVEPITSKHLEAELNRLEAELGR